MPIVKQYETLGKTKQVDALRSMDEVYTDVVKAFEGFI
jgi:adenylate kinase family enzyme